MGNSRRQDAQDSLPFPLNVAERSVDDSVPVLRLVLQPAGPYIDLKKSEAIAGRHSTADVRLPLANISRFHCRFFLQENAWHVMDLNSVNGVFVNGERITHTLLREGDAITIGTFQFVARINPVGAEAVQMAEGLSTPNSDATQSLTQSPREPIDRRKAS